MGTRPQIDFRVMTEPQQGARHTDLVRVAQASEQLGFHAFFRSDHYLKVGSVSGLPGPSDAWLTLAALAVQTTTIRLGTLVTPVTFRPPGPLALAVAQVDQMSGGRVELGLGAGWYEREHLAFGVPFPTLGERHERLAEQARIVLGLWQTRAGEAFSFSGRHYTITDSPGLPPPVQRPHPPLIFGGTGGHRSVRLAAELGEEYNVPFRSVTETAAILERVAAASQQNGRSVVHSAALTLCLGRDAAELGRRAAAIGRDLADMEGSALVGTPDEVTATIDRYVAVGVTRFYLQVQDLTDLDHLVLFAREVMPTYGAGSC